MEEKQLSESVESAKNVEETTAEQAETHEEQTEVQKPEKKYTDEDVDKIIARKIAAERNRMKKLFENEQQESEIEKRERNVQKRELMADARDALTEQGFPSALAKLLDYSSEESCERSMTEVQQVFTDALQNEVKKRLAGNTPRASYGGTSSPDRISNAFAPKVR